MNWFRKIKEYKDYNLGDLVYFTEKIYDKVLVDSYGLYFGMNNKPYGYHIIYSFNQKRMRSNILLVEFDKVKED